jgi:hypothetical protein
MKDVLIYLESKTYFMELGEYTTIDPYFVYYLYKALLIGVVQKAQHCTAMFSKIGVHD